MSSEPIELVKRGYDAYESDGIEGTPAVEWRNPPDSPIAGVFQRHDGLREWQRLADEGLEELHFSPQEIIEAPDGRVLAICNARVRGGRGSETTSTCPSRT